jgi:hypothetical protein
VCSGNCFKCVFPLFLPATSTPTYDRLLFISSFLLEKLRPGPLAHFYATELEVWMVRSLGLPPPAVSLLGK